MSSNSISAHSLANSAGLRPSTSSVWYRMSWKEFRQNAPLLGVFVCGLLLTLTIATVSLKSFNTTASDIANGWFGTIYFFIPVFALAVGVFIFAPEKENRTAQFLEILPVSNGQFVITKLVNGLATVVVFISLGVILQLIGPAIVGAQSSMFSESGSTATNGSLSLASLFGQWYWKTTPIVSCILLTLECFFWGAISSLIFKRAIFAAVMAGACFALVSWGLPTAISAVLAERSTTGPPSRSLFSTSFYTVLLTAKALTYVAMGLGLTYLGSRWLGHLPTEDKKSWLGREASVPQDRIVSLSETSSLVTADRAPVKSRVYFALLWQSFRQFRFTFCFALLGAAPCLLGILLIAASINEFKFETAFVLSSLVVALVAVPLIASMFVFQVDHQDRNYRFFQEHREYGRKLWLARLLPAALVTLVCGLLMSVGVMVVAWESWISNPGLISYFYGFALVAAFAVFCAFAIGQFNSMFLRSGVFIVVSVLVMSGLSFACIFWLYFLDGRLVAILLPVPMAMLAITWWRAPHWLAEHNRVANFVLPWLMLGVVVVGSLTAFSTFRVASVPDSNFSLDELKANYVALGDTRSLPEVPSGSIFERAILLRDAADEMVAVEQIASAYGLRLFQWPTPDYASDFDAADSEPLKQFVAQNKNSLQLIALANQQRETSQPVFDPESHSRRVEHVAKISLLISAQARVAELDGDLELALQNWLQLKRFTDRYDVESPNSQLSLLRWSGLPGQSPDLIKQAIRAMVVTPEQWREQTEFLTQSRKLDFANWYEGIETGQSLSDPPLGIEFNFSKKLPWEMERSKRWVYLTIDELAQLRFGRRGLLANDTLPYHLLNPGTSLYSVYEDASASLYYPNHQAIKELFSINDWGRWGEFISIARQIQSYHYVRLRMALNGWKSEHGGYPDQLSDLVPSYFESLPLDVLYGMEFAYSPEGLDAKVCVSASRGLVNRDQFNQKLEITKPIYESMIEPGQPFLLPWSLARKPPLLTCSVMDEPNVEAFDCYNFSGPDFSLVYWDYVLHSKKNPDNLEVDQ